VPDCTFRARCARTLIDNDIAAVEAQLRKLQIEITEGPITLPDGGVMLFVRDQDKNVIEFHQDSK